MKTKLLAAILFLFLTQSFAQTTQNMSLKYNWVDTSGMYYNTYFGIKQYFNEVWGWHNSNTGEEFAVIGAADGTYFFDVTNPDSCYLADYIEAKDRAEIHRDYKSYQNYVYMVADEGSNSLQVYDMSTLPDSATLVYDNNEFVYRSHNIFIDEGVLYMVSPSGPTSTSGFRMLDIATNPEQPAYIADFSLPNDGSQGYHIHDLYVKNKKAYCSNGNSGYFIYDVNDPQNITTLASIPAYTEQGYNHNSWLNEDCSTIFFTDENLGLGIKSYDVSDLNNIVFNKVFRSNVGAMAHNVIAHGNMLYVSYYHDGVVIFDITDPANPVMVAQYDTYIEQNGYSNYQGCWGVYPFLPSGTILASDFENGLFVLSLDSITPAYNPNTCIDTVSTNDSTINDTTSNDTTTNSSDSTGNTSFVDENYDNEQLIVQPNPGYNFITFGNNEMMQVTIVNTMGKTVLIKKVEPQQELNIHHLSPGMYFIKTDANNQTKLQKFIKE